MKPLPFLAMNLLIGGVAVFSQRLLLPGSTGNNAASSSGPNPPGIAPSSSAADPAAVEALYAGIKGKRDFNDPSWKGPAPAPKIDYEDREISVLEKNKAALKGTISDYQAEVEKLISGKLTSNLSAVLSLWLDADPKSALGFLQNPPKEVSGLALKTILRAYYRDHGQSGFTDLVHSSGKLQLDLAGAVAAEDPVRASSMLAIFSDPRAVDAIKTNAFSNWPLDQKDQALSFMASSLGQQDYAMAFQAIGRRLDVHELVAWAASCAATPGLPEAYRHSILSAPALRNAFLDSQDLSFWERTNGIADTISARDSTQPAPPDDIARQAAQQVIQHDVKNYLTGEGDIKSVYSTGAYSARQVMDDLMSKKDFAPEYRSEVAKEAFKVLAPLNPSDALTLLDNLPVADRQSQLLDVAQTLNSQNNTLEEVTAVMDALPGDMSGDLAKKRELILKNWVDQAMAENGPASLNRWIQSADLGDSRQTLEKLIANH